MTNSFGSFSRLVSKNTKFRITNQNSKILLDGEGDKLWESGRSSPKIQKLLLIFNMKKAVRGVVKQQRFTITISVQKV